MSQINLMRQRPHWKKISKEFGTADVTNQPDGVYLFPTFSGSHNFGHWHLTCLKINDQTATGWTMNSIQHNDETSLQLLKELIGKVINKEVTWRKIKCFEQK